MMRILYVLLALLICFVARAQDSTIAKRTVWLNLQGAIVLNSSFSNTTTYNSTSIKGSLDRSHPICLGYYGAAEMLWGKRERFRQVLALGAEWTRSILDNNVSRSYYSGDGYSRHYKVNRSVLFAGISYGIHYTVFKRLKIDNLLNLMPYLRTSDVKNGYASSTFLDKATGTIHHDTTFFYNEKTTSDGFSDYISFRIKLSYDFKLGANKFSAFVMRSIGAIEIEELLFSQNSSGVLIYRAPWWMFGIHFYPFRKMQ